jgi:nucleoside 2-deoxyribosyltransferase
MPARTIYLAGPDVFLPNAVALGEAKKQLCAAYGFEGLFPLDHEIARPAPARIDLLIYRGNTGMIRRADCAIFNLTPFRGPSADAGTAFELGMVTALDKPRFAYTNQSADYVERVCRISHLDYDPAHALWRDADDLLVEDFGNVDNLMIDGCLEAFGGIIRHDAAGFDALAGFEECLRRAQNLFRDAPA